MNTPVYLQLCYKCITIIISSIQVVAGQKILLFNLTISESTCTQPHTIRQYLDHITFLATLEYNNRQVDLHSWFLFTVNYNDKHKPDIVRTVSTTNLVDCKEKIAPDESHPCTRKDDRINLAVSVVALTNMSQMSFFSKWVSLRQGHVRSVGYVQGPTIVAPESETLEVDDKKVLIVLSSIQLIEGSNVQLRYCVTNILTHTLRIEFGDKTKTATGECVELEFIARGGNVLALGYDETRGSCKQKKQHYFALASDGKNVILISRHTASYGNRNKLVLAAPALVFMVLFGSLWCLWC